MIFTWIYQYRIKDRAGNRFMNLTGSWFRVPPFWGFGTGIARNCFQLFGSGIWIVQNRFPNFEFQNWFPHLGSGIRTARNRFLQFQQFLVTEYFCRRKKTKKKTCFHLKNMFLCWQTCFHFQETWRFLKTALSAQTTYRPIIVMKCWSTNVIKNNWTLNKATRVGREGDEQWGSTLRRTLPLCL